VVKWLTVQDGVLLTADNKDGLPPIHCAWESGHLEVVNWLLGQEGFTNKIQLSSSDDAVEGSADICLEPEEFDSGDDESVDAPVPRPRPRKQLEASTEGSDQSDIFQACAGGHLKIVKLLVEQAWVWCC
jgi:hypothetical protein